MKESVKAEKIAVYRRAQLKTYGNGTVLNIIPEKEDLNVTFEIYQ